MPGMFYSLKETALKLGISDDQVKQLVKDGKLREFRDGSNLLFKIDEVNSLQAATESEGVDAALDGLELNEVSDEQPAEATPEEAEPLLDEDLFKLDEEETPAGEPVDEVDATSELGLAPEETSTDETAAGAEDLLFLNEEAPLAEEGTAEASAEATGEGTEEEISLASESGILAEGSDITDADTALTAEGVNVLGESSTDFNVTDDSMAETAVGPAGSSAEASLEEIEDDVNLDSFGSGSGLLDLSLQADDTSLGGILDEIYTADGGEPGEGSGEGTGEASDAEPVAAGEEASFDDITAEADRPAGEEEMTVPEPVVAMAAPMGAVYAEAAPDAQSNILGLLLFLPLLALLYTAIVAVSGLRGVMPGILSSIQGFIWYLLGAGIVIALIVTAVSFMAGRERSEAAPRVKKEKVKAEKPKKEKKAKDEKPAKAEKPAKEKRSFFGKKK